MTRTQHFFKGTILLLCLLTSASVAWGTEYQHEFNDGTMQFCWSVDGDNINIKISAPTTGWLAVGFNPTHRMKHANIIIGYVKDKSVTISDEYGVRETGHDKDSNYDGINSITNRGGSEQQGVTTLEFRIPLNNGETTDSAIDIHAETMVILAHGRNGEDNLVSFHQYRTMTTINLATGKSSGK